MSKCTYVDGTVKMWTVIKYDLQWVFCETSYVILKKPKDYYRVKENN